LIVGIHQQHIFPALDERRRQVDGRGRLSRPAFIVRDRDDVSV
jgi:hypothetical protein